MSENPNEKAPKRDGYAAIRTNARWTEEEAQRLLNDPDVTRVFQLFTSYREFVGTGGWHKHYQPGWEEAQNAFLTAKEKLSGLKRAALFIRIRNWNESRGIRANNMDKNSSSITLPREYIEKGS